MAGLFAFVMIFTTDRCLTASGHLAILHATSLLSQETPAQATALSEPLSLAVGASIVYISRLSTIKKLAVGTSDGAVAILDEK